MICGGGWSVGLRPALRGAVRPERKPPLQIGANRRGVGYERDLADRFRWLSFSR